MLILLGFFGFIIFFICSMISNYNECPTNDSDINFCLIYDKEKSSYYFDNFVIFFKKIWLEDRTPLVNCIYIIILLLLH